MDYMINYEKDIQAKLDRNEKLLRDKAAQIAELQYETELIADASIEIIRGIQDHVQMKAKTARQGSNLSKKITYSTPKS